MSAATEEKGWGKYGMPHDVVRFQPVGKELAALFLAWNERMETRYGNWSNWKERAETVLNQSLQPVSEVAQWLKEFDDEFHSCFRAYGYCRNEGGASTPVLYEFGFSEDDEIAFLIPYAEKPSVERVDMGTWLTFCKAMSVATRTKIIGGLLEPVALHDWLMQFYKALNLYATWFDNAASEIVYPFARKNDFSGQVRPLSYVDVFLHTRNAEDPETPNVCCIGVRVRSWVDETEKKEEITGRMFPPRIVVDPSFAAKKGIRIKALFEIVELKDVFSTPASCNEKYFNREHFEPIFDDLGSGWSVGEFVEAEIDLDQTEDAQNAVLLDVESKADVNSLPKNYVHRLKEDGSSASVVYGFGLRVHYYAFDCSKAYEFRDEEENEENEEKKQS